MVKHTTRSCSYNAVVASRIFFPRLILCQRTFAFGQAKKSNECRLGLFDRSDAKEANAFLISRYCTVGTSPELAAESISSTGNRVPPNVFCVPGAFPGA